MEISLNITFITNVIWQWHYATRTRLVCEPLCDCSQIWPGQDFSANSNFNSNQSVFKNLFAFTSTVKKLNFSCTFRLILNVKNVFIKIYF